VYWLRGSPVILHTPIAQRRFFGNLLDGVQLPIQDSYVPSKLLLPNLPTTIQKRRLFVLKVRSSGTMALGAIHYFNTLEQTVWRYFSQRYASELAGTENIRRVQIPTLEDPVEVANLLRYTDMYLFEHTINAASQPWPPPMTGSEPVKTRNLNGS
jgi:hypothetical protein